MGMNIFLAREQITEKPPLDGQYELVVWRPSLTRTIPPSLGWFHCLWWLFHYLHVFKNRDYTAIIIKHHGSVIHRSVAVPAYFRWPFMNSSDIQISSTWTSPEYRGQGLATVALKTAMTLMRKDGRRFWYISRAENNSSTAVCKKAGFRLYAKAGRSAPMGLCWLGQVVIKELVEDEDMDIDDRRADPGKGSFV
jgi:RimJ/RimL family protein N-acetyltransferase